MTNSSLFPLQKLLNTDSIISLLDKDNKINEMGGVISGADGSSYSFIFSWSTRYSLSLVKIKRKRKEASQLVS